MNTEIQKQLEAIAYKRTIPFCYADYRECPKGVCEICGSDDLMRLLPGEGVEWGVDWVVKAILKEELTPVDLDEVFEEHIRQCYPETTDVGWLTLDTVSVMKDQDPVSWRCAQSEWESQEADEGSIVSFDNGTTYYSKSDLEEFIATD